MEGRGAGKRLKSGFTMPCGGSGERGVSWARLRTQGFDLPSREGVGVPGPPTHGGSEVHERSWSSLRSSRRGQGSSYILQRSTDTSTDNARRRAKLAEATYTATRNTGGNTGGRRHTHSLGADSRPSHCPARRASLDGHCMQWRVDLISSAAIPTASCSPASQQSARQINSSQAMTQGPATISPTV